MDIIAFPPHLLPVQVDDQRTTQAQMGRGAVAITVQADSGQDVRLIATGLPDSAATKDALAAIKGHYIGYGELVGTVAG